MRNWILILSVVACSAFHLHTSMFKPQPTLAKATGFRDGVCSRQGIALRTASGSSLRLLASAEQDPKAQQTGLGPLVGDVEMSKEDRITLWAEVEEMETKLQEAIDAEEYSEAATIRDRIKFLKLRDPYAAAKDYMERSIAEEKYEEAARWRNKMKEVGEPPQKPGKGSSSVPFANEGAGPTVSSDGVSSSDITTLGVRVQVSHPRPLFTSTYCRQLKPPSPLACAGGELLYPRAELSFGRPLPFWSACFLSSHSQPPSPLPTPVAAPPRCPP